jgi:hypothetical protein
MGCHPQANLKGLAENSASKSDIPTPRISRLFAVGFGGVCKDGLGSRIRARDELYRGCAGLSLSEQLLSPKNNGISHERRRIPQDPPERLGNEPSSIETVRL